MSGPAGETPHAPGEPYRLPMFPLSTVLFPRAPLSLHVFEPRYRALVEHCVAGNGEFGVVLISRGSEVGGDDERLGLGTVAQIEGVSPLPDGRYGLLAFGSRRISVDRWQDDDPYPVAIVREIADAPCLDTAAAYERAVGSIRRVRALLSELGEAPALPGDIDFTAEFDSDSDAAMWSLCSFAPVSAFDDQRLLAAATATDRMALLGTLCDEMAEDVHHLLAEGGR